MSIVFLLALIRVSFLSSSSPLVHSQLVLLMRQSVPGPSLRPAPFQASPFYSTHLRHALPRAVHIVRGDERYVESLNSLIFSERFTIFRLWWCGSNSHDTFAGYAAGQCQRGFGWETVCRTARGSLV
jgi:hypothetical protein